MDEDRTVASGSSEPRDVETASAATRIAMLSPQLDSELTAHRTGSPPLLVELLLISDELR